MNINLKQSVLLVKKTNNGGGEITKAQYLDEVKTHKELLNNY